jgi:hypothetical protein
LARRNTEERRERGGTLAIELAGLVGGALLAAWGSWAHLPERLWSRRQRKREASRLLFRGEVLFATRYGQSGMGLDCVAHGEGAVPPGTPVRIRCSAPPLWGLGLGPREVVLRWLGDGCRVFVEVQPPKSAPSRARLVVHADRGAAVLDVDDDRDFRRHAHGAAL